ncbi:WW domain-binding protein 4 [Cynoglossus semilaevis]|uniref:WW domain binding protein 4 n=1 Tax=Cynoglossus semilaevis TaxID=244447 RepID=A0A3P8V6Q6_CYNSE|nr:WW domain-binding protein 4 [Cynoglossus semilaevis]
MADYWKSQPRKFCQYCKCWIADNKPSVEFHERGKNHKENVAAKISEIKKKSIEKQKQEERMSKDFAKMEEAAMKAYEEDLKRMAGGSYTPPPAKTTSRPHPQVRPQPKVQQKKGEKQRKKPAHQPKMQVWVEGQAEDGTTYYYNTVTGESRWENPGFQGAVSSSAYPGQTENYSSSPWMEAVSPEGYTYYYNTETGESSWEKPPGFPNTEASESGSNKEGKNEESPEESSTSQAEPTPEVEEKQKEDSESSNEAKEPSKEAEAPDQASQQQPKIPKISFRKRKSEAKTDEEKAEPEEKAPDVKKEEEPRTAAEPEEKKTEVKKKEQVTQAKRQKTANPYGAWEQIRQEEDPYAKVDLQLPQVDEGAASVSTVVDLPPEPRFKFKERIITSLGDDSGPALFRKNKTQNGKSRSLRQRDDDD